MFSLNFNKYTFSALVRWQEGHPACKKLSGGMLALLCLSQNADLLMTQLMPLPLTMSCSSKSRLVLPFWCRLTRAVLDKIQEGHKMVVWPNTNNFWSPIFMYITGLQDMTKQLCRFSKLKVTDAGLPEYVSGVQYFKLCPQLIMAPTNITHHQFIPQLLN